VSSGKQKQKKRKAQGGPTDISKRLLRGITGSPVYV